MRIATFAAALSISLFSTTAPAGAQSVGYISGPDGPTIFSLSSKPITRQDIDNFETVRKVCDKARFDAGLPYIDSQARLFMQTCVTTRFAAASHERAPKWRESVGQAAELCKGYVTKKAVVGPPAYRVYAGLIGFTDGCLTMELDHKH